ncbi:MAG TPA: type II toxin-antitoxin system VapC family toxin [Burkholderiaceae bacterium]|nr:type II toxin-antitoxin system VapC family toxin [Burkholderiaceae bacterium]
MKVVDTNILVYLLLEGPHSEAARALHAADSDWQSESFLMVELVNVLATAMRTAKRPLDATLETLAEARHLMSAGLRSVEDRDVLNAAAHFGISGYDARFLVVAQGLGEPLVTEDARLRRAAPEVTCSLAEALAR